jgi:hypothetical protein
MLALGLLPALTLPASAALSPLYESVREIEAILQDGRLVAAFANQEAITSITNPSQDVYELKTQSCTIDVTVATLPKKPGAPMMVGPRQFELQFGQVACQ